MPSPRRPLLPRFAPKSTVTLVEALDSFGRAIDPAWTGEEIEAEATPEPSDEHLANVAFAQVTREASDKPLSEVGIESPTEREILAALHAHRDITFAPRRRSRAAG